MANLLPNPSFETNTNEWGMDAEYTRSSESAYDGTYAIKHVATSGWSNFTTENDAGSRIAVTPGDTYQLTFWYKLTINSGGGPRYEIHDDTPYAGNILASGQLSAKADWYQKVITFVASSSGYVSIRIYNADGNISGFYDMFDLEDIGPSLSKSPSASASPSKSPSASKSPSQSYSPSPSASPSKSPSKSASPSKSPSASTSPTRSPSASISPSRSASKSVSPSKSPSASVSPSPSPSLSPSASASPSAYPQTFPVDEPMITTAPDTGALKNSATWVDGGAGNSYLQLTTNINNDNGEIEYDDLLPSSFVVTFDYWAGGGNGADAVWFYFGASSTPTTEYGSNGYSIAIDEYNSNQIQLHYNNSQIAYASSGVNIDDSAWHTIKIIVNNQNFSVYYDNVLKLSYYDSSSRSFTGNLFGWGARTGGLNNYHRVRNLIARLPISTPSASASPSKSPSASASPSLSQSASLSTSVCHSASASKSPSASASPSKSASKSPSASASPSPSPSAPTLGYVLNGSQLPRPESFSRTIVQIKSDTTTVNGKFTRDLGLSKQMYTLGWDSISKDEANTILQIVELNRSVDFFVSEEHLTIDTVKVLTYIASKTYEIIGDDYLVSLVLELIEEEAT